MELPALKQTFVGVKVDCRRGEIGDRRISCEEAAVTLPHTLLDRPDMRLNFELDRATGSLTGQLRGMAIAGGALDLHFVLEHGTWQIQAKGKGLKLASLAKRWPPAQSRLKGWSLASGRNSAERPLAMRSLRPESG